MHAYVYWSKQKIATERQTLLKILHKLHICALKRVVSILAQENPINDKIA